MKIPNTLLNKISKENREKLIQFVISPDEIRKGIKNLVEKITGLSKEIHRPEHYIISSMLKNLWDWPELDLEINKEITKIDQIIDKNLNQVEKVSNLINSFDFLWKKNCVQGEEPLKTQQSIPKESFKITKERILIEIKELEDNFSLDMNKERIKNIFRVIKALEEKTENHFPSEINLSMILVDCSKIKEQISNIIQNLQIRLEKVISKKIFFEIQSIIKKFEESEMYLSIKIDNAAQLVKFESYLEKLRKVDIPKQKTKYKIALAWLREMIPFLENSSTFRVELFKRSHNHIQNSQEFLRKHGLVLTKQRDQIENRVERMKENLRGRLEEGDRELDNVRKVDQDFLCDKMLKELEALQKKVDEYKIDAQLMQEEEATLGKIGRNLPALQEFETNVGLYRELWVMVELWTKVKEVERSPSLLEEKMDVLKDRVGKIRTSGGQLLEEFKKREAKNKTQIQMISRILKKLEAFWGEAEVLVFLCNPKLQVRHWNEVNKVLASTEKEAGLDGKLNANYELSWNMLEDLELYREFEKFQLISNQADREYEIQEQLKEMRHFWERRMNLNCLLGKVFLKKKILMPSIKIHSKEDKFEVVDSIDIAQIERRLEEDALTLERVQMFPKFSLFEYEIEELKQVITKTRLFTDILKQIKEHLEDMNILCTSKIVEIRVPLKVQRAQEIEERIQTILDTGNDLGIDRVMASKENEYLFKNFEKELSKLRKELWYFVNCLRERPGRVSWLSCKDVILGEDLVKMFEESKPERKSEENPPFNDMKILQTEEDEDKEASAKEALQSEFIDLASGNINFLQEMAILQERKSVLSEIVKKIFRGIHRVEIEEGHIIGFFSFNGEYLELTERIKIEISFSKLIKEIELALQKSIRKKIYEGLSNFSVMDKKEFLTGKLNQIIFLVEMVVWTYEVESIIVGEGLSGLTEYTSHFYEYLEHFHKTVENIPKSTITHNNTLTIRQARVRQHNNNLPKRQTRMVSQTQSRRNKHLDLPISTSLLRRNLREFQNPRKK
jgi:hypothetical protein